MNCFYIKKKIINQYYDPGFRSEKFSSFFFFFFFEDRRISRIDELVASKNKLTLRKKYFENIFIYPNTYTITIKVIFPCQSWLDQLTRQIKESITRYSRHDASDRSIALITTRFPLYSAAFQFAIVISSSQQDTAERNNTPWSLTRD